MWSKPTQAIMNTVVGACSFFVIAEGWYLLGVPFVHYFNDSEHADLPSVPAALFVGLFITVLVLAVGALCYLLGGALMVKIAKIAGFKWNKTGASNNVS